MAFGSLGASLASSWLSVTLCLHFLRLQGCLEEVYNLGLRLGADQSRRLLGAGDKKTGGDTCKQHLVECRGPLPTETTTLQQKARR